MSKAIVINSANFSAHKIDTINFGIEAPTIIFDYLTNLCTIQSNHTIYYTTNGDTPTTESTLYTEAFSIDNVTVVKAIAYDANSGESSSVARKEYILMYKLPFSTSFNGTNQIDTGIKVLNGGTYTILIDFDATGYASAEAIAGILSSQATKVWYRNLDHYERGIITDGWNQMDSSDTNFQILNSGSITTAGRIKMAIIINGSSLLHYNSTTRTWKQFIVSDAPLYTDNAIIGGWNGSGSTRRMVGMIFQCEIWNKAFTQQKCEAWCII